KPPTPIEQPTATASGNHRVPQPPHPAATSATGLTTAATTTAAHRYRIPQPPRFSVRSMAHSASPFNKITIQRDNTTFDAYIVRKEDAPGIV
ncbi:hypothetical protein S245_048862, partial [Arachis hypogaea]